MLFNVEKKTYLYQKGTVFHASLSFLSTGAVQHRHRRDWNHLGSDETRSLSWILYGAHGSGRQTESSRYELCSQTIIAFSLVLFISVSLFRLWALMEAGKESGTCNHTWKLSLPCSSSWKAVVQWCWPRVEALQDPICSWVGGAVFSPAAVCIRSTGGHFHLLSVYHLVSKAFSTYGDV